MKTPVLGVSSMWSMVGALLSTVMVSLPVAMAPTLSVAVTVQVTESVGLARASSSTSVSAVPSEVFWVSLVQAYVSVGVSPSISVAVTLQVRVVDVVTPEFGRISTRSRVGRLFSMDVLSLPVAVAPTLSVAVTVHDNVSPGLTRVLSRARVSLVPIVVFWVSLVQL